MPGQFPIVGDALLMRTVYQATGAQVGINNFGYKVTGIITGGASLQELATAIDVVLAPIAKALIPSNVTYRGIGFTNLTPPRTQEFWSNANLGVGTNGTLLTPTQVAGIISYYGTFAGPRNRGRNYIPFVPQNEVTATGLPQTTYTTALGALVTFLLANRVVVGVGGSTTLFPAINHRPYANGSGTAIFTMAARTRFGTQRKRGSYGQLNRSPF